MNIFQNNEYAILDDAIYMEMSLSQWCGNDNISTAAFFFFGQSESELGFFLIH